MATTSAGPAISPDIENLQQLALRHLWMHFTRMGGYDGDHEIPIIMRGEGPYVFDQHGKRYLDGLSGLFCSNLGHGRTELGEAAARQVEELDFTTLWSYAHPRAIELAAKIASLAPGDLNRVFFTSGGSEAVESAIKLARAYHQRTGNPRKIKFISREVAYHGTSLGALAATGITALRTEFEPLVPGGFQVPNTNSYHWPADRDPLWAADQIEEKIEFEGPETVAAVILEPVQNAGGCIPPQEGYFQRVREICDRHDVLLISDEVICAWGRLGHWFGCQRYDYQPDIITTAKALTSAYVPMGGMVASDRVAEPFMQGTEMFTHGFTFAGHPVAAAVALATIDIYEREDIPGHVLREGGRVPRHARVAARHPDRRRRARRRLLPRDRAGQGPGDQGVVLRRGGRVAPARLPLRRALPPRPDLPRRRPRRPGDAALAAADLRHGAVRGDRGRPAPRADRGLGAAPGRLLAGSDADRRGARL